MGRRDLKIQKNMSEIAGDAFFWVYFSKMSWRRPTTPNIREGYNTEYSPHHNFAARKCQITPAFETKYYGHPVSLMVTHVNCVHMFG